LAATVIAFIGWNFSATNKIIILALTKIINSNLKKKHNMISVASESCCNDNNAGFSVTIIATALC